MGMCVRLRATLADRRRAARVTEKLEGLVRMIEDGEMLVEDFLAELDGWERAYPLSAFPEPDLAKAAELLKAGGMTLDAVSASNMRHVVSMIAPKARAALNAATLQPSSNEARLREVAADPHYSDEYVGNAFRAALSNEGNG